MTRPSRSLMITTAMAASAAAVLLSGCGPTSAATPQTQTGTQQSGQGSTTQQRNRVSGLIAEVDGKTFQVQTRDSQTAVTYTASTTFTEQVTAKASAVTKGSCVVVRSADSGSSSSAPAAQPAQPASQASTVTATSVTISAAAGSGCRADVGGGMGGGTGGGGMGGGGGVRPSGAPTAAPSGAPGQGAPGGTANRGTGSRPVFGTVTAVTSSGFTLTTESMGAPGQGQQASPQATPTPQTVTVTTTATTTYAAQQKTTAKAAKTGVCLTANGKPNSVGAVAATAIALQPAVDGACTTGGR